MKRSFVAALVLAWTCCCMQPAWAASSAKPAKAKPAAASTTTSAAKKAPAPSASTAGETLPDSALLARVQNRSITAKKFSEAWFDSDPQVRPRPDSLGRVEFLNSMVTKEILALVAKSANRPLDFEDRATMREHTNRVLANVLYQRMVIDSIVITEEDIQKSYETFKNELRLKHIQLRSREEAEKVRRELVSKRTPWSVAVRKYSTAPDKERDGDMGWRARLGVDALLAMEVFTLDAGQISPVIEDPQGYHVIQVAEKRPAQPPALQPLRGIIHDQIQTYRAGERTREIQARLIQSLNVVYDEPNIAFTAKQFEQPVNVRMESAAPVIELNPNLPELTAADNERVLARYKGGEVKLRQLIHSFESMPPMMRPSMNSVSAVKGQVDAVLLEPTMLQLAIDRGMEKDPVAVELIDRKREQIAVEHLFEDSIQSRVVITDAMRRKYYEENKAGFITYPKVRFAAFSSPTRGAADSLKVRLAHGEKAEAILRADSLAGMKRGSIQSRQQNEHGPYHKVLFEEMRPGQVIVEGPDRDGTYLVLQLIEFDAGHQLQFAEVERMIDESLQNIQGDVELRKLVERHRSRYRVDVHPERVMAVRLVSS